MLRIMLLLLPLPDHPLAHSEPVLCAEGTAITSSLLQSVLPHCVPAPQRSQVSQPNA